jgi:hypothetical protein
MAAEARSSFESGNILSLTLLPIFLWLSDGFLVCNSIPFAITCIC